MKKQERYFVATENPNSFELEAIFWAKTLAEAVDEAERRKRMFPEETVLIAKVARLYDYVAPIKPTAEMRCEKYHIGKESGVDEPTSEAKKQ